MFRSRWPLVALFIVAALICARLGFWQLDRLDERRARNAAAAAGRAAPAADVLARGRGPVARGRSLTARGTFDYAREIVLVARVENGTPGVHVLTPLRITGSDSAVLVNRGFLPAADAFSADVDAAREPETATVSGSAQPFADGDGRPARRGGRLTLQRPELATIRAAMPYPLVDVIIRRTDSAPPNAPRRIEAEPLDDGPHVSYAIQWFSFAVIALVFAAVVARRGAGRAAPAP